MATDINEALGIEPEERNKSDEPEGILSEFDEVHEKKRHGCVTAWLVLMIISNALVALVYLFAGGTVSRSLSHGISSGVLILLALVGVADIVFAIMLLQWKKAGFWGFVVTSIIALCINVSIGVGVVQSFIGLVGLAILYGILQIKAGDVSAWDNLE